MINAKTTPVSAKALVITLLLFLLGVGSAGAWTYEVVTGTFELIDAVAAAAILSLLAAATNLLVAVKIKGY